MLLHLKYDSRSVRAPVISKVAIEENALINIIEAKVEPRYGEIVVEVDDEIAERVAEKFRKYGVEVRKLTKGIEKSEKCVDCGACISVCPTGVFSKDEEDRVVVNEVKCIRCGFCVNVCPLKALRLPE